MDVLNFLICMPVYLGDVALSSGLVARRLLASPPVIVVLPLSKSLNLELLTITYLPFLSILRL